MLHFSSSSFLSPTGLPYYRSSGISEHIKESLRSRRIMIEIMHFFFLDGNTLRPNPCSSNVQFIFSRSEGELLGGHVGRQGLPGISLYFTKC